MYRCIYRYRYKKENGLNKDSGRRMFIYKIIIESSRRYLRMIDNSPYELKLESRGVVLLSPTFFFEGSAVEAAPMGFALIKFTN